MIFILAAGSLALRRILFYMGEGTLQNILRRTIQEPMICIGGGFHGIFISTLLGNALWFLGIHGGNLTYSLHASVYQIIKNENISAFLNGIPAPHPEWFMNAFIAIGGMGCTFALNLLMLFKARSRKLKALGKISITTSIFQINEPIILGFPIVGNPLMIVPFVLCPCVNLLLSWYFMVYVGLIAPPSGNFTGFYLPFGIYGFVTTGHIGGLVWSLVLLILNVFIYYPFFRIYDMRICQMEEEEYAVSENC